MRGDCNARDGRSLVVVRRASDLVDDVPRDSGRRPQKNRKPFPQKRGDEAQSHRLNRPVHLRRPSVGQRWLRIMMAAFGSSAASENVGSWAPVGVNRTSAGQPLNEYMPFCNGPDDSHTVWREPQRLGEQHQAIQIRSNPPHIGTEQLVAITRLVPGGSGYRRGHRGFRIGFVQPRL